MPDSEEQMLFYEKIASYVQRHPEFIEELKLKILKDENEQYNECSKNKKDEQQVHSNNYTDSQTSKEENNSKTGKGFFKLDDERINKISQELTELIFEKDNSNKSVLEKTIQDAFSGIVRNCLGKYAG